jgi:transglutaminase-like putative cysteine protease
MGIVPALLGAALAITAPLAVSPALSTLKVSAIPFGQQGGGLGLGGADGGPSGGPGATGSSVGTFGIGGSGSIGGTGASGVRTIDLVDNLQAVLTDRSGEVMFKAQTPHPTYWQMAVLTTFNGEAWVPDPTTESAAQAIAQPLEHSVAGLPALAQPRSTPTYRATVTIENLESTLLPLPPTTTSVGSVATVVPGFGAVQPVESPPGETFTAVAHLPVKPSAADRPSGSGSARAEVPASSLAPYLALPAVSQQIVRLAHQIVAHADNPAAKAAALARWFDTGRFRYTLSPPPSTGADPLSTFLFVTRAGFCQQFAAAYAVLARLDGLPTRVAIGFTTGAALGRDRYAVTGADAHVWPEVYLGPEAGWTSYEPTPATSTEPTGIGVNAGTHSAGQVPSLPTSATSSTVTPSRHVVPPRLPVPSTVPLLHRHSAAGTVTGTSRAPVTVAVAIGAVVLVAVAALWMVARRRRPPAFTGLDRWRARRLRRPASGDPSDEVLARWREAAWILDRGRLGKLPSETLQEHAARLSSLARAQWLGSRPAAPGPAGTPEPMGQVEAAVAAYGRLAALAARAAYGDDTCTSDDALDAVRLGAVVRSGMAPVPAGRGSSGAGRDTRVPV